MRPSKLQKNELSNGRVAKKTLKRKVRNSVKKYQTCVSKYNPNPWKMDAGTQQKNMLKNRSQQIERNTKLIPHSVLKNDRIVMWWCLLGHLWRPKPVWKLKVAPALPKCFERSKNEPTTTPKRAPDCEQKPPDVKPFRSLGLVDCAKRLQLRDEWLLSPIVLLINRIIPWINWIMRLIYRKMPLMNRRMPLINLESELHDARLLSWANAIWEVSNNAGHGGWVKLWINYILYSLANALLANVWHYSLGMSGGRGHKSAINCLRTSLLIHFGFE